MFKKNSVFRSVDVNMAISHEMSTTNIPNLKKDIIYQH